MKFALIIDTIGNCESYYTKDSTSYSVKNNKPYSYKGSIGSECFMNTWNYPWLYENGYFINWNEYKDNLPKLDLDVIFVTIERFLGRHDWCNVSALRKQYPNAKIIGFIKEVWAGPEYDFKHPKHIARINFLNQCDGVIHNRPEVKEFINIQNELKVPMQFIAQPHNVEYFYKNFYKEKNLALYEYIPNHPPRHGTTRSFCDYMNKKYNIPIVRREYKKGGVYWWQSQEEFIKNWSSCLFHVNLDPIEYFPGNQCTQVVSTGTIQIGGLNDNHRLLCPETATNDWGVLEEKILEYVNNEESRFKVIENSWNKVNDIFSFNSVRINISNFLKKIK
jgi:hypothetical protein